MSNILSWNAVALELSRRDHSQGYANGQNSGPTKTSRALAIAHIAIYNAVAAIERPSAIYMKWGTGTSFGATPNLSEAIDGAASQALRCLYPRQIQLIDDSVSSNVGRGSHTGPSSPASVSYEGGKAIGQLVFDKRKTDKSDIPDPSPPGEEPPYGAHRSDPFDPKQPLLGKHWGQVDRFTGASHQPLNPFPGSGGADSYLSNAHYRKDYEEVKAKGSKASGGRLPEEAMIGTYWAYDGATGIGVPPRLYNQIIRTVLWDRMKAGKGTLTDFDMALLFAKANVAMADAGIDAWHHKYDTPNNLWRPVIGIRKERAGHASGSASDPFWAPLGAPQTNKSGTGPRTPPFPAYPSGHATFGAALFQILRLHFGGAPITVSDVLKAKASDNPDVPFSFVSDELDGIATDTDGSIRTKLERTFTSFPYAVFENAISRVYLGVHWRFDGLPADGATGADLEIGGVPLGLKVGSEAHDYFNVLTAAPSAKSSAVASKKKRKDGN